MAWTQADILSLKGAMATGAKSVTIAGETTIFRDLDEMERLLRRMEAEVAAAGALRSPRRFRALRVGKIDRGL
jgi:hypothetical protein